MSAGYSGTASSPGERQALIARRDLPQQLPGSAASTVTLCGVAVEAIPAAPLMRAFIESALLCSTRPVLPPGFDMAAWHGSLLVSGQDYRRLSVALARSGRRWRSRPAPELFMVDADGSRHPDRMLVWVAALPRAQRPTCAAVCRDGHRCQAKATRTSDLCRLHQKIGCRTAATG